MGVKDNPRRGAADDGDLEAKAEEDLDRLGRDAADAAASLVNGARKLFSESPELERAAEDLRRSIRKNPLAAIGVAFVAGLLLALLTRG